jgi:hypothetical protein
MVTEMSEWTKQTYQLEGNYRWKSKPGNVIFVADRGAVRFDYPGEWILEPGETFKLHDHQPPDDTCVLQVSIFRLGSEIDWSSLPSTDRMLAECLTSRDRDVVWRSEARIQRRAGVELAWVESHGIDPGEQRLAISRTCLAAGGHVRALLTLDFWPEDQPRLDLIWEELLRTLEVGDPAF